MAPIQGAGFRAHQSILFEGLLGEQVIVCHCFRRVSARACLTSLRRCGSLEKKFQEKARRLGVKFGILATAVSRGQCQRQCTRVFSMHGVIHLASIASIASIARGRCSCRRGHLRKEVVGVSMQGCHCQPARQPASSFGQLSSQFEKRG